MQLVSKATTPKEARDEIVKYLRYLSQQEFDKGNQTKHKLSKDRCYDIGERYRDTADFIESIIDGAN